MKRSEYTAKHHGNPTPASSLEKGISPEVKIASARANDRDPATSAVSTIVKFPRRRKKGK